nr:MAG TPA: hypothetical protein [Caudoviricetes sp.]
MVNTVMNLDPYASHLPQTKGFYYLHLTLWTI